MTTPYMDGGNTTNAYPFGNVRSACPTPGVSAAGRVDPFWAGVWEGGSTASWVSEDLAHRQADAGLARIPAHLNVEKAEAFRRLLNPSTLGRRLDAMAVIDVWRTVTGEQAAAITGDADLAGKARPWAELFATGIADAGIHSKGLYNTLGSDRGMLWRPSRTHVFDRKIRPQLTYPEVVSITGGYPWESGSQFDRHNVLTTELALRAAEWCPVGAVLGEKLSTLDLLAYSGAGFEREPGMQAAADATIVRPDGLRIAIEMTASTGKNFDTKVERWARILAKRRLADTGLVVLFVVAPRPDKKVNPTEVHTLVKKRVAAAARKYPGVNFDRTADRMFVASWTDWFPAPRHVQQSFFLLNAERPSGTLETPWKRANILHPADVPFQSSHPEILQAILTNSAMLRAVPHWLRKRTPPTLWPQQVTRAGFNSLLTPAPVRPEIHVGKELGASRGAAPKATAPKRLRTTL